MPTDIKDVKEPSPKELALKSIPQEWREKMIAEAAHIGCKADDDVLWTVIASVINAWACAGAAGRAADAVQISVDTIPDKIFQGAIKAGQDINSQFQQKFGDYGQTLITTVDQSRDKAITEINKGIVASTDKAVSQIQIAGENVNVASQTLENMLNGVIEQKAKQGLTEWADAAKVAGQNAAQAAAQELYNKASLIIGGALLLAGLTGGGIVYWGAGIDNRIAPLPIELVKGAPDCFRWKGMEGAYCRLSGTAKQMAELQEVNVK